MDKILGLEYGADDYITKPFNILELKAKLKLFYEETENIKKTSSKKVIIGKLILDIESRRVLSTMKR